MDTEFLPVIVLPWSKLCQNSTLWDTVIIIITLDMTPLAILNKSHQCLKLTSPSIALCLLSLASTGPSDFLFRAEEGVVDKLSELPLRWELGVPMLDCRIKKNIFKISVNKPHNDKALPCVLSSINWPCSEISTGAVVSWNHNADFY